ncbi:hypothetical protein DRI96_04930 [Candidatus Aerophobetes bacterium]|uniref:Uncharacterized protein n=1 Tax=Aerophobetes bacterium TaxID=2030807 RepID=A0A662DBF7_UNCAE|nr:MAG: hypothetical protein DRI96_04930 [Candidatus Aerophobetes bacterium]
MKERLNAYRRACLKAVEYQLGFQLPDGGYIWEGYVKDAYYKQPLSWQLNGHSGEALRLLNWVRKNKLLQNDGQLKDYNGDLYKHSWFFQGAHLLGQFDLSYPVMSFLLSQQAPCGGLPHFVGDKVIRSLSTAWTGISVLYFGNIDAAKKIAQCSISMLEQQPREDRFYFQMTRDGKLVTEKEDPEAQFIDATKPRQCYWEAGFPMLFMCKMYQATGDKSYLDFAKRFFEFYLRFYKDNFSYWGSGKGALAAATYYMLTGDEKAKEKACEFCDFVVKTQLPDGSFHYEDTPDELLYHVDHAACFSVWVRGVLNVLESLEKINLV